MCAGQHPCERHQSERRADSSLHGCEQLRLARHPGHVLGILHRWRRPPGVSWPKRAVTGFKTRPRFPSIWPEVHRGPTITTSRPNGMTASTRRTKGPGRAYQDEIHAHPRPTHATVPPWSTAFHPGTDRLFLPYVFTHGNPRGLMAPPRLAWLRVRTTFPLSQPVGRT